MANGLNSDWRERIRDLFWATLTGDEDKPEDVVCLDTESVHLLPDVESVADKRIAEAEERYRDVERKLLALLTLTTVLSAVITAGVVAVATLNVDKLDKIVAIPTILVVAYIALQLARTLFATVSGLKRREFYRLSTKDISPCKTESAEEYKLRVLNKRVDYMFKNELTVNRKVDDMNVAHEAIRNALGATLLLIILASIFAVWQLFTG